MKKIHKHTIPIETHFSALMPMGARILNVGVQNNVPCFWYIFDTEGVVMRSRDFTIVITGGSSFSIDNMEYVGTFQVDDRGSEFVGHLFVKRI